MKKNRINRKEKLFTNHSGENSKLNYFQKNKHNEHNSRATTVIQPEEVEYVNNILLLPVL